MSSSLASTGCRSCDEKVSLGDKTAEHQLIAAHYPVLLARLRVKVRDPAAAEDICQSSFLIAIQMLRRGTVRDRGKFRALLFGIAERQIAVQARSNRIGVELTGLDPEELEAYEPGPPEILERAAKASIVQEALSNLAVPRDRELLVRRYWLDQSSKCIRQELKLTSVALKKAISRARARLRKSLRG